MDTPKDPILCRPCRNGDCYSHVAEYLNHKGHVMVCQCSDPLHQHGKLKPVEK